MELSPKAKKLLSSKEWRLSNLYKIVDRKGDLVTFRPNAVQKDYLEQAHTRNLLLKSRQHGFTTLGCVDGFDDVLFQKNFSFTIIADNLDNAKKIFEKIELAWKNFPRPIKNLYEVSTERSDEMAFSNGSSVRVTTSARSSTTNRLHISEIGTISTKYPQKAKEIIDGSIPAVPRTGRVDIETTAKGGEQGLFFELCSMTTNGLFEMNHPSNSLAWKFFFYGWLENPENELDVKELEFPNEKLSEYQELHDIPDKKMAFYIEQWKTHRERVVQEFPTYPEEAFSVGSTKLFPRDILLRRKKEDVEEGRKEGKWTIFDDPRPDHRYALGADVAEGVGQDSSTVSIIDFSLRVPKVVATFADNQIAPDVFAYEIRNGARKYSYATCAVERNNQGITTIDTLKRIYDDSLMYRYVIPGKKKDKKGQRLGWVTNRSTKPLMLYDLKSDVQDGLILIPDERILKEMLAFSRELIDEVGFDEDMTQHFDLLIATAIALQMKTHLKQKRKKKATQYRPSYP